MLRAHCFGNQIPRILPHATPLTAPGAVRFMMSSFMAKALMRTRAEPTCGIFKTFASGWKPAEGSQPAHNARKTLH